MIRLAARRLSTLALLSILLGAGSASMILGCAAEDIQGPTNVSDDPKDPEDPGPSPTTGVVHLVWDAPRTNADGSAPLTDLAGYTLYYGSSADALNESVDAGTLTQYDLELPFGTYFVGVTAYDIWRNESSISNVITVEIAPPATS